MPRPMTPHADPDSRPGTPRATSPSLTSPHTSFACIILIIPRRHHISYLPAFCSQPMFLHRSPTPNGHQIPESPDRSATASPSMENRLNRRPASPLAPNTYQPMAVPARIGTPPHLAWGRQAHNRDNSWISETTEVSSPYPESNGHSSRSLRSPPLPDSPVDRSHSHSFSFSPGVPEPSASPGADSHPDSQATPTGTPAPTFQTTSTINSIPQQTSPTPYTPYSPPSTGSILDNRHLSYQSSIDPSQKAELKVFHFKPNANSSRSSLDSTSSSYHSESGDQSDLVSSLFERADSSQTSWHDLSVLETSPANSTSISETQADEIIGRHGLKSSDFLAIQNKLFSVAMTKLSAPESLERVGSLRRRRGSTSHNSIHGRDLQRLASPPPRATSPPVAGHDPENLSRATNLLHSISTHPPPSLSALGPPSYATSPSNKRDVSPGTQRNRDLADMIFGGNEEPQVPQQAPVTSYWNTGPPQSASNVTGQFVPPAGLPVIPQSPPLSADQAELERQVLYKNNAAMIALRKRPSNSRIGEPIASPSSGSIRKKVTPQQISTPTLVSASASVDTIDLPVANSPSQSSSNPSKLGSTLKRLRGTLRAKPSPTTPTLQEPITSPRSPPAASPYTPTSSQYATYNPSRLHPGGEHPIFSATEPGRFKVPLPSPPASAGPGLKGFMSRFRGTKRETNMNGKEEVPYGYASPYLIASPSSPSSAATPQAAQGFGTPTGPALHPPSTTSPASMSSPNLLHRFEPPAEERQPPLAQAVDDSSAGKIQHLFDVASDLGVDREALNELLSRSGSTSSQATRWSKATALDLKASQFDPPHNPPTPQKSVRAEESPSASTSTHLSKSPSVHRPQPRPRPGREAQTADGGTSVVLRRTLIFPSDMRVSTADPLSNVKRSMSQKKRMSAQSHSTRSVHDRIPTPPPPAAAPVDAFSDLPPLPGSLAKGPGVPMPVGIGSGAYDSFGDHPGETLPKGLEEPGSALQVIELANGDTIWSIVNGLRDDDESLYPGRSSFASEYSYDDMQVNFKEHARKNSQGSHGSHPVRKADYNRPETKVFYSSPAQIGKLIENLSTGMDAGAFNIMPHRQNELPLPTRSRPEHSATSSMSSGADWTMEDRLEHVLQSLNGPH
ncbi:hypothetical protein DL96DRAFT_443811 [Flagelloscypha sp. PMI_526]|nr:hypothetical protein DL96DRAFT_443811 [Flagelloscypha sp. PMI_526]